MPFNNLGPSSEDDWDDFGFDSTDDENSSQMLEDDEIDFGVSDMEEGQPLPQGNSPLSGIDMDEDFDIGGTPQINEDESGAELDSRKSILKTAFISIGVGAVIILVALFIFARVGKGPTEPKSTPTQRPVQTQTPSNQVVEPPSQATSYNNWVEFRSEYDTDFSTVISSTFTVTNIQNFACVVNENNDKIVKSIITGNISGLIGTYEAEIPYDIGRHITLGTTVKCEYSLWAQDGVKVIGGIKFP